MLVVRRLGLPAVQLLVLALSAAGLFAAAPLGDGQVPAMSAIPTAADGAAGRAEQAGFGADPAERSPVERWLGSLGQPAPSGRSAHAASAITPGGLIGGNFPISTFPDAVSRFESLDTSSSAYNPPRGEYLVVWHAFDRVTLTNIYGQRVTYNGTFVGGPFAICEAAGAQLAPSVSFEPTTGTFWVAWTDFRTGKSDVRVRRVSGTGAPLGSEFVVNDGSPDAFAGRLACRGGTCVVVWASDPHDGNGHILLHSYNASTLVPNTLITLLSEGAGTATEPDIGYNPDDDRFMVVWHQWNGVSRWDIWSFHLTWDIYGIERKAISTAVGDQQKARVAYGHGAARYMIVWQDGRSGVTWDVYGQRLDRGGAFSGATQGLFLGPYNDVAPAVAGHGQISEFFVAFQRDISGAEQYEIYAFRVTGAGAVESPFVVREWYNARFKPSILPRNGSSDFFVTFTDDPFGTQADIGAQIVRLSQLWKPMIVISRGRKGQEAPALAYNSSRNEYLPVWADYRSGSDYDLYYRRVSAAGVALDPELILASAASLYGEPAIAYNRDADEHLAVWQEVTSLATGFEIYARRMSGAAGLLGSAILVSRDTATVNEGRPRVVYNAVSREYLVVWHAFTNGVWRIWGQRVSAAAALLGGNVVLSDGLGTAQNPRVAHNLQANEYVVIWQDYRNNRLDVFAQRLAAGGTLIGYNYPISEAAGNKNTCDLAYSPADNGYLTVWGDTRSGGEDVWAQRLDAAGAVIGDPFPVADSGVGETSPSVAYDVGSQEFLVTWWALNQSTDYDVFARRVPAAGLPSVPGFSVSAAMEVQNRAELVQNTNTTEFLVLWQDFRNGSYDVYGQRWMRLPRARLHRVLPGHEIAP